MKDSKVFLKKKKKMRQYACERYKNLPEDEKQKFFECRSIFHKMKKKTPYYNYKNYYFKKE